MTRWLRLQWLRILINLLEREIESDLQYRDECLDFVIAFNLSFEKYDRVVSVKRARLTMLGEQLRALQ